jgi:hypothetical protein
MELIEVKSLIWAQKGKLSIEDGGPLLSMSIIKLGLLKENDK